MNMPCYNRPSLAMQAWVHNKQSHGHVLYVCAAAVVAWQVILPACAVSLLFSQEQQHYFSPTSSSPGAIEIERYSWLPQSRTPQYCMAADRCVFSHWWRFLLMMRESKEKQVLPNRVAVSPVLCVGGMGIVFMVWHLRSLINLNPSSKPPLPGWLSWHITDRGQLMGPSRVS